MVLVYMDKDMMEGSLVFVRIVKVVMVVMDLVLVYMDLVDLDLVYLVDKVD